MEFGKCFLKRIARMNPLQKIALLLIIGLLFYSSLIAINELVISPDIREVPYNTDVDIYRNRTIAILHGEIPYKDFSMESPPIIDYMMVPAQLAGGANWQYALYFSLFSISTGIAIYAFLRRYDDSAAFTAGLAFILMPYAFVESTFGVQDEAISTFVFLLPLLIFVLGRFRMAALVNTIGFWTKFFNGVIYLVLLIKAPTRKDALKMFGITALVTAAVAVPFLIIAPDKFLSFPSYYLLQDKNAQTGGMSIWHFWDLGGFTLPGTIGVIMMLVAVLAASYYVYRKKDTTTFWEGCIIVLFAFFLFYPKIHLGYYLMLIAMLLMWGATNRKVMVRCLLAYVPLFLSVLLAENMTGKASVSFPGSWFVGFLLVLGANIFLLDTFIKARRERVFFERTEPVSQIIDK